MWMVSYGISVFVPNNFSLVEVFPPEMWKCFEKDDPRVWLYMNTLTLITIDRLRKRYGPAFMNTYGLSERVQQAYGTHYYRGWRDKHSPIGANLSQHKMGRAGDMVFASVNAELIRRDILAQPYDTTFEYITSIEMEVGWLHFDVRPYDKVNKGILKIFP